MEDKNYYVYEYYALHDGVTQFNGESFDINKGDVYYIGKGIGKRVSTGIRNMKCEHFKKVVGFGYRIVKDGLSEEEALQFEKELINKYKEDGMILTNKLSGNIAGVDIEAISQIKYLILLVNAGLIKMSQEAIALESETYQVLVNSLFNLNESDTSNKYNKVLAKCPDNIDYILEEYNADKLSDRDIKFGNIKYVLNLLEKNVIKTNQREIADFYEESTAVVSGIKKDKYQNINLIKPTNLAEILKRFDIGKLTDNEIKEGSIKYIIDKLIEPKILNMTLMDLAKELGESHGITYNWLQDLKRRRINVRYVKPSPDVLANLFDKYHEIEL
ncbi:hypothetical protein BAOM_1406 [Peribacillus asahii]|uniref:Uncharacterized protein n=1 Tax=Peribacillus asahii TaxID=228899 RepID=A0A3T0KNN4_9BACI|nr:hypothetical protein [Peribacillus asahii]AZV42016.1 hypothetical protein BAOM_1406 [Peribacillus asahii]